MKQQILKNKQKIVVDILQSNATAETKAELYLGLRTEGELSDEFLNAAKWQDHQAEQVFFKRLLLLEFSQWKSVTPLHAPPQPSLGIQIFIILSAHSQIHTIYLSPQHSIGIQFN